MGLQILDGSGKGILATVDASGQLSTVSEMHALQHHLSLHDGLVFQVIVTHVNASGGGTYTTLHVRNTSASKLLIVTYIRLQAILDYASSADDFFQIGFDRTYSSGGSIVTPINTNRQSGHAADAIVYNDNPNLTGTFTELDRWYIENDKMMIFNKEGSVILGQNNTIEVRVETLQTGTYYSRMTFMFKDPI